MQGLPLPLRWLASCLGFAAFVAGGPVAGRAADQAGVAAAVRGSVSLARATVTARPVTSGESIFMLDQLKSGPSSGMQILLLDETVFTIGPESELIVDEFVYDADTSAGKVGATVAKGVFRFVTGKVAKRNPRNMQVSLPAGNIGVRGTVVAGRVDDVTRASLTILLGDSRGGAGGGGQPAIEVCNAGACERVVRPGYGVRIEGADSPPGDPFPVPQGEIDAILAALANPESVGDPTGQLDQAGIPMPDDQREIRRSLQDLNRLDTLSDRAAQDAARGINVPTPNVQPDVPTALPPPTPPPSASGSGPPTTGPKGGPGPVP